VSSGFYLFIRILFSVNGLPLSNTESEHYPLVVESELAELYSPIYPLSPCG